MAIGFGVCGDKFPELRAEALAFPAGSHDDLLDALAGAYAKAPRVRGSCGSSRREEPRSSLFTDMLPEGDLFFDMLPQGHRSDMWRAE